MVGIRRRRIGRTLLTGRKGSAEQRVHATIAALGFQPRRHFDADDTLTYELCNCPYREAVRERRQVVCGLHRGMTRGLLDAIDPETELTGFVPKDPYEAGCLIELRGPLAAEAVDADAGDADGRAR